MAVAAHEVVQQFISREATKGPVTTSRQRRAALIYAAICVLGLVPIVFGMPPGAKAAGIGLWIPGGGFVAAGGWAVLLFPVTLVLFALAIFAWFGAGMVIGPILVWGGAAILAGAMTGDAIWLPAVFLVPAMVAAIGIYAYQRAERRRTSELQRFEARRKTLPAAIAEAIEIAAPIPSFAEREMSAEDLAAARYLLDRALQPVGEMNGYDKVDQFQTSAWRYQINNIGYALSMIQCHYAPSFHGYLGQAQRNLIELYLRRKIWSYWIYESAWGHLNLTNPDPADKDNIMLTGWFGLQVGMYMLNSGDRRYAEPGSLTFRLSPHRAFAHDLHSIEHSVMRNFLGAPFCLYPCEPNWVYPICNHFGMASLAVYDRVFGTKCVDAVLDNWLKSLDTEFTDYSGSVIGLRSELTGIRFPFPAGEAGFAIFENCFAPERAQRMWAIARGELKYIMKPDASGADRIALAGRGFDFGNYRPGFAGAYASIMDCAREFGDYQTADAAQRALDQDCGRALDGGVLRYSKASNLSNIMAARSRIHRRDDFRKTVTQGPPESAMRGPILAGAKYPDVLVARAFSNGEDLELVLHPGANPGTQNIRLERLRPGANYVMRNGAEHRFAADNSGAADLSIELRERTRLQIAPAS
jgi:Linalool dehydratase/isomerase